MNGQILESERSSEASVAVSPAKKARVLYLDVARVVAIISISMNHAVNRTYTIYTNEYDEFMWISQLANWIKTILYVFSRVGVPLFLMITGALILSKSMDSESKIRRFYKHNLLSLFITSEIWFFIMYWFILAVNPSYHTLETEGIIGAIPGMIQTMLFQNQITLGSMWYMPMILALYSTLPILILAKERLKPYSVAILLPMILVFLNCMVRPMINNFRTMSETKTFSTEIDGSYLLSFYFIYMIIGYWVSKGGLKKMKGWLVAALCLLSFALMCAYQYYAFSTSYGVLMVYNCPFLPVCAGMVFELIRRKADLLRVIEQPITYLSKISFGIYFLHVIIMWPMFWYLDLTAFGHVQQVLIYEVCSVGGSVLVIALLSKIPFCKKYLFMIKD